MTQYLPPNLLALFAPRDPISFLPPLDKLPHEKKLAPYNGVAQFLGEFEDPKDTPPPTRVETKDERKERKRKERAEQVAYKLEQDLALWDPTNNPAGTSDPFKTLFVGRINYDTSESKLRREFESYGPVRKIRLITNQQNAKPRGYGFVEYEHERDMHSAYKHADGKKIDGRRVLVDVERSRTVKGWRPRRLGGGLGGTRKGGPDVNTKYSGREESAISRDDRSASRERERDRRRGGPPGRRGGSRSRSRERERPRRRSRSRERRRRSRSKEEDVKKRRRSRSRDRKRSRSRDRKRSRRSRSPRDRKRDRSRDRREREKEEARAAGEAAGIDPDMLSGNKYDVKTENGYEYDPSLVKEEKPKPEYEKYAVPKQDNGEDADQNEPNEYGTYGEEPPAE